MFMVGEGQTVPRIDYSTVSGLFMQDEPHVDPTIFDYTKTNFGLIDRTYETDADFDPNHKKTQWQRFEYYVQQLNKLSKDDVRYKLLYMGRHGEGVHNVAESYYGTTAWNDYWAKEDGNGTTTWADAHLTPKGIQQALAAHSFWVSQLEAERMPAPEKYYASPLHRCLATANNTFFRLELPEDRPFVPEIKEVCHTHFPFSRSSHIPSSRKKANISNIPLFLRQQLLRETIGEHTCDRRSTATYIHAEFPDFPFEPAFSETDPLWSPTIRETHAQHDRRMKKLLDDVFTHDGSAFISFTSHSGAIASILRVLQHREFPLLTGAAIPVLVKAKMVGGTEGVKGLAG
ncbi:MAG: hypothetical protein M1819_004759 [Sarea resinae]|nr:MAG: hypothetical protein M1819_004759 [Sarea resinae]